MGEQAGFFGDASYTADVRAAFAGVPRVKPQWRDRFMKVLVVGESGLGAPARAACRLGGLPAAEGQIAGYLVGVCGAAHAVGVWRPAQLSCEHADHPG